jgi:hypothetical protein
MAQRSPSESRLPEIVVIGRYEANISLGQRGLLVRYLGFAKFVDLTSIVYLMLPILWGSGMGSALETRNYIWIPRLSWG